MATLALSAVGSAVGSALLPSGLSILGATLTGAALGQQLGAVVGSQIDQALFGPSGGQRAVDGPRLSELRVTSSTEGAPIPRLYGTARIGGQLIWATALEEEAVSRRTPGGGKSIGGSRSSGDDYVYYGNCAIALCEGVITGIGRVWADGREIDISNFTTRLHRGTEQQATDALLIAKQGPDAPAYRGLAYIVFERLPLADFGNRLPQFSFEVSRSVDTFEASVRGVVVIPGSGEFAYGTRPVNRQVDRVTAVSENVHTHLGGTDWSASIDQLQAHLPNAQSVSLTVSWFGDDLRAGHCTLTPRVERLDRLTSPLAWGVAGLTRATAQAVSTHEGRAAYGGTPSDQTVIDAIRDLKVRGLSVVFSPFILMDIDAANTRPDPYGAQSGQAAYPWRGRITVSPAAGVAGTVDKTAAAQAQLAAFIGTAQVADFDIAGDTITFAGAAEWSFRRFILHYAHLCKAAGGVDAFVLCSELRGLTTARDTATRFPFVSALQALASEVRDILGAQTKILYAADWSEYFGYQPADGSGDVLFHLDPLWASPHIDAIGIDLYWPLSDWRDGDAHLDATLAGSPHELSYLKYNAAAGEGFDWYYATATDRAQQVRTAITDGRGKPWVFRYKDIKSWWSNAHYNRLAGVEVSTPTAWVPQSKPFWFTEVGCPAVDKGANQPNVFVDPKSAESLLPHFSSGVRDDLMQRRTIQAMLEVFDPLAPGYVTNANPVSTLTGNRMVDVSRMHVYAWDARPFPAFPNHGEIWRDAANWPLGHWINGRSAAAPVPDLVQRLLADYGFSHADAGHLIGTVSGLVVDRLMSARDALQPLQLAFFVDVLESDGTLRFQSRSLARTRLMLTRDDLVDVTRGADGLRIVRAQETDLPRASKLTYLSARSDYPQAVAEAQRGVTLSNRVSSAALGLVLDPAQADAIADTWLFETWASRERATFTLPPSRLAVEPGDVIAIDTGQRRYPLRVVEVGESGAREIQALSFDSGVYTSAPAASREELGLRPQAVGPPLVTLLDVPLTEAVDLHRGSVAVAQEPWPGPVAIFSSPEPASYRFNVQAARAAVIGTTRSTLRAHAGGRFDHTQTLTVELDRGALASVTDLALFDGANTAAIEVAPDVWEVVQFRQALLIAPKTYALSGLLRGQRGTDGIVAPTLGAGRRFVLLDDAVVPVVMSAEDAGRPMYWKAGPARRDIGDSTYVSVVHGFGGVGLVPYAPVHVRGRRDPAGALAISWIRRTRVAGDSWDGIEVPLGEEREAYAVDILDGTTVKRTLTSQIPSVVYSVAAQIEDFGMLQPTIAVRVVQMSASRGRGYASQRSL